MKKLWDIGTAILALGFITRYAVRIPQQAYEQGRVMGKLEQSTELIRLELERREQEPVKRRRRFR
jgi:hypothetical protein